jgi:CRISPR/Cas system-associated exonuclease Cas4 (RecB family)
MKINHISISRDSCWQECQQKYKFRYHLEVVVPGVTLIYLTFGKIVHKIIETYTLDRGKTSLDKISKDVLTGKIDLEPGSKAPALNTEYKNKLVKHLQNFMRFTEKFGLDGEVEWKFNMDMDGEGRCMTGVIDRMIRKGDEFFLLDYKTTKPSPWRKDSRTITKDLQLMCYCYVVMKEFGADPKNIQAALVYLDDYKLVPVRFSEKTLLTVPERMLKVYKDIEEMNPDRVWGNVGKHCQRCDYRKLCPFYSLT